MKSRQVVTEPGGYRVRPLHSQVVTQPRSSQSQRVLPLAIPAAAPRCTAPCACHWHADPSDAAAATSATTDAAAATSAGSASSAASTASASSGAAAATTATASSRGEEHAARDACMVQEIEMEGGEADVGEFFLTEHGHLAGREIRLVLNITGRHRRRRCASRERKSQAGCAQRRYSGFGYLGFGDLLLFRRLLRPLHGRILQSWKNDF